MLSRHKHQRTDVSGARAGVCTRQLPAKLAAGWERPQEAASLIWEEPKGSEIVHSGLNLYLKKKIHKGISGITQGTSAHLLDKPGNCFRVVLFAYVFLNFVPHSEIQATQFCWEELGCGPWPSAQDARPRLASTRAVPVGSEAAASAQHDGAAPLVMCMCGSIACCSKPLLVLSILACDL